ncbi:MAG: MBOAT family protein [Lachnospiraceae bacterium]|nr:MBOAT family protein [Lachnospiraceae bacterium]
MLFSSMLFLWIFLPTVLVVNMLLGMIHFSSEDKRIKVKNIFLLIASLIFYAWGGVRYLLLMLGVIFINYLAGILTERLADKRKLVFVLAICANLGLLFYFKYFNLFIHTIEEITGKGKGGLQIAEVVLPIGISFYIFQAMSYTIDVYRNKVSVQKDIFKFALYVALFPQLIAGPIVIYNDVKDEIEHRHETMDDMVYGIGRFCIGLGKKVIIANALAEAADGIWDIAGTDISRMGAGVAWFGMIAYTLQIYYDFSGYSDMAIGLGRMLGFHFKENFNYPYISTSIKEFWRRWHISLSSWFRDYVYIPLGGSRTDSKWKIYRNLLIVFLLTGIWHGANYTFFVWGLLHGILIVTERAGFGRILEKKGFKPFGWIYTSFAVMIGWVFFRSDSIEIALGYIKRLFAFGSFPYTVLNFCSMRTVSALVLAILCMGTLLKPWKRFCDKYAKNPVFGTIGYVVQICMLLYSIVLIVSGTYNPFIYFQF